MTAAAAITLVVSVTTASAPTEASAATTLIASPLMAVLHIALTASPAALTLASWTLLRELRLITTCTGNHTSAGLRSQVIWDRIVDLPKLSVSMRILTVFVPLTISLVLKVATFLRLKPLIDLALLELWLLAWHAATHAAAHATHALHALHASHRWLLRLLHLLLHLLLLDVLMLDRHGHLLLRLLLLLGIANHLLLAGVCLHGHGHLRGAHGLRHRCLKLLLHLLVLHFLLVLLLLRLLLLLLLLRIGLSLHFFQCEICVD